MSGKNQAHHRCTQCWRMWRLVLVYMYQTVTQHQHKQLAYTQTIPLKQSQTKWTKTYASATNTRIKDLAHTTQPDIITVQETKLARTSKIPSILSYTLILTDRVSKLGGGLLIHVKHNITFTDLDIPTNINTQQLLLRTWKLTLMFNI